MMRSVFNRRMGGATSDERKESMTKEGLSVDGGIYYRDPNISNEFNGPFDETKLQQWYREGFFHSGIQFKLNTCSGYCTLGRLRELNGNACPFAMTADPRDEKIRYLEDQLRDTKWRLIEMREENVDMRKRMDWLETAFSRMNDEFDRNRREADVMRNTVEKLTMQMRMRMDDSKKENDEIERRIERLEMSYSGLKDKIEREKGEVEGMKTIVERSTIQLEARMDDTKKEIEEMEKRIEWLEADYDEWNDELEEDNGEVEGTETNVERVSVQLDSHMKSGSSSKVQLAKIDSEKEKEIARVAPEQKIVQKAVEQDSYKRFIKEILGWKAVDTTKASESSVKQLVEALKGILKNTKKKMKLCDVLQMHIKHYSEVKCSGSSCARGTLMTPINFLEHLAGYTHVGYMKNTGVSSQAVAFFIEEFKKIV